MLYKPRIIALYGIYIYIHIPINIDCMGDHRWSHYFQVLPSAAGSFHGLRTGQCRRRRIQPGGLSLKAPDFSWGKIHGFPRFSPPIHGPKIANLVRLPLRTRTYAILWLYLRWISVINQLITGGGTTFHTDGCISTHNYDMLWLYPKYIPTDGYIDLIQSYLWSHIHF